MSNVTALHVTAAAVDRRQLVIDALAAKPDGVVEVIARECGVSSRQVLEALPPDHRMLIPAERFEAIWTELTGWGEVLFIVHTADIVLECNGMLPIGTFGHGYFNIHGDSPIGGHIRASNCRAIYLVDRPFHGKRSCSVQFYNEAGEAMFKVFVRRNKARELIPQQLALFEAMTAGAAL